MTLVLASSSRAIREHGVAEVAAIGVHIKVHDVVAKLNKLDIRVVLEERVEDDAGVVNHIIDDILNRAAVAQLVNAYISLNKEREGQERRTRTRTSAE